MRQNMKNKHDINLCIYFHMTVNQTRWTELCNSLPITPGPHRFKYKVIGRKKDPPNLIVVTLRIQKILLLKYLMFKIFLPLLGRDLNLSLCIRSPTRHPLLHGDQRNFGQKFFPIWTCVVKQYWVMSSKMNNIQKGWN